MATPIHAVIQHLRSTVVGQHEADVTDGHLLAQFIEQRDPAAISALIRRHGTMVWGVCRRVLGDDHDAEDAFQATFLVLVRKAASVRQREAVASWLYSVAHQTARKAMIMRSKRRTREKQVSTLPEPDAPRQAVDHDLQPLLDRELSLLPDKYRTAIVLCDLEGKSRNEVARQLGLPEGTLAGRLARGRALLAKRLSRHGLGVASGAVAGLLAQTAGTAAAPPAVVSATIKAVTAIAVGHAAAGVISVKAAALSEGMVKAMFLNKLIKTTVVLLVLGAGCLGAGLFGSSQPTETPQAGKPIAPEPHGEPARRLLDKAINALGGEANLAKLKIVREKGTYRRFIDATEGKVAVSWEQISQEPDRFKNVQEGDIDGVKLSQIIVFNGSQGWTSMNGKVEAMDKEMLASVKEDVYASGITSLLPLKQKEYRLSIIAEAKVDGRPAAGLKVSRQGHADVKLYFDKGSGLLVKQEQLVDDDMESKLLQESFFSDYQETDKVKVARKQVTFAGGKKIAEAHITEVEFLTTIADKVFERPDAADTPMQDKKAKEKSQPPPVPARPAPKKDEPSAPEVSEDLTWRPAKVTGPPGPYLVLVDPGAKEEFLPAAEAMAALHGADLRRFDPARLDRTMGELRKAPPRFVVFVLPPEKIDVDFSHAVLEMATQVDDDPFVDFEYGFITGRTGAAALRFVKQIEKAWRRDFGAKATLFASWEGFVVPTRDDLSALRALGFAAKARFVRAQDDEEKRLKAAQQGLLECKEKDALIFMSHGYPDRMELCFSAQDLRAWKVDLAPAILFNCACFNGAPGRWFHPTDNGYEDRGIVRRDDSVALALLETGIAGYFAGVDSWHGPLTSQVFYHVTDDGMRLGEAANAMHNRLALEFLPGRIHFEPTRKQKLGGKDMWVQNQRHNGAGMILYGDPALAPFAQRAKHLLSARVDVVNTDRLSVKITVQPLIDGQPGEDFGVLPINRLFDYYSLRSDPAKNSPKLELYRVVPLPARQEGFPALRVVSARSGDKDVPTGSLQLAVEDTPDEKLLHIRVPLQVSMFGDHMRLLGLVRQGLTVELEGK